MMYVKKNYVRICEECHEKYCTSCVKGRWCSNECKRKWMNINYKKDFKKEGSVLNIRFKVFCRDNFKCAYCGRSPNKDNNVMLVTDHIAPKSKGGSGKIDNYITSCYECNEGKKDSLLPDALLSHFKQKNIQTTKSMLLEK